MSKGKKAIDKQPPQEGNHNSSNIEVPQFFEREKFTQSVNNRLSSIELLLSESDRENRNIEKLLAKYIEAYNLIKTLDDNYTLKLKKVESKLKKDIFTLNQKLQGSDARNMELMALFATLIAFILSQVQIFAAFKNTDGTADIFKAVAFLLAMFIILSGFLILFFTFTRKFWIIEISAESGEIIERISKIGWVIVFIFIVIIVVYMLAFVFLKLWKFN